MERQELLLNSILMCSLCPRIACAFPLTMSSSFVASLKVAGSAPHRGHTRLSPQAWEGMIGHVAQLLSHWVGDLVSAMYLSCLSLCLSPWRLLELEWSCPVLWDSPKSI